MKRYFSRKPARSFGEAIRGALKTAILGIVPFAMFAIGASLLPMNMTYAAPEHSDSAAADLEPTKGTQAWAIEKNGCVKAQEGALPEGVVYSKIGTGWKYSDTDKVIGMAFEQLVFDGAIPASEWIQPVDHDMRIGVFCR